jgi:predicted RNA binding protein YcfA (HicA-like mRNA interferase family)
MPKLYSSDEILKIAELIGFVFVSQKGSHGKFKDKNGNITIIPMNKKEIPAGTFSNILKQLSITKKEFESLYYKK